MAIKNHSVRKAVPAHYAALVAKAAEIGWPTSFATDLTTHDRATLERRSPALPFLWVLRASGTQLVLPSTGPIDGVGHRAWEVPAFIANAFGAADCLWFWWNGSALERIADAKEAARRLRDAVTCSRDGCEQLLTNQDGWYCTTDCRTEAETAYAREEVG